MLQPGGVQQSSSCICASTKRPAFLVWLPTSHNDYLLFQVHSDRIVFLSFLHQHLYLLFPLHHFQDVIRDSFLQVL